MNTDDSASVRLSDYLFTIIAIHLLHSNLLQLFSSLAVFKLFNIVILNKQHVFFIVYFSNSFDSGKQAQAYA